ncbi:hypothetical protein B484DRAFT_389147, partial [Ochromonadaceae sp. CCMP2298]
MRRFAWLALIVICSAVTIGFYDWVEGWSTIDSILFVCITITTIGYGNLVPSSDASRLFTIVCMFVGILIIFSTIKHVVHTMARTIKKRLLPGMNLQRYVSGVAIVSGGLFVFVVLVGTVFIQINESTTFVMALYFIVSTATTVGYGDTPITHLSTKIFLIFYTLASPIAMTFAFDNILCLGARLRRQKRIHDILTSNMPMGAVLVDFAAERRQLEHRMRKRQHEREVRGALLRAGLVRWSESMGGLESAGMGVGSVGMGVGMGAAGAGNTAAGAAGAVADSGYGGTGTGTGTGTGSSAATPAGAV